MYLSFIFNLYTKHVFVNNILGKFELSIGYILLLIKKIYKHIIYIKHIMYIF